MVWNHSGKIDCCNAFFVFIVEDTNDAFVNKDTENVDQVVAEGKDAESSDEIQPFTNSEVPSKLKYLTNRLFFHFIVWK